MKSGTRDEAEGKTKEIAGKTSMDPGMEVVCKDENLNGKVQEKIGQVKKLVGKQHNVLYAGTLLYKLPRKH